MKTSDFDYQLPPHLIAQEPLPERDSSRLLVVHRASQELEHRSFSDLPEYFEAGDCLVVNNTKVLPVRLWGLKAGGGARIEMLLLEELEGNQWKVLAQRAKRLRPGVEVIFSPQLKSRILEEHGRGVFTVEFSFPGDDFMAQLKEFGEIPLPPYIERKTQQASDHHRYQTVYARHHGSAAAPTAGFHFTDSLLKKLQEKGVERAEITLHVGLDTFKPIQTETIEEHPIHTEKYEVSEAAAATINQCRSKGGRIIAVGTTSVRTLESVAADDRMINSGSGATNLFIYPGYEFKIIDGMITNFHLPGSSLVLLVAALLGQDYWRKVYEVAMANEYRFYSYGDASLII